MGKEAEVLDLTTCVTAVSWIDNSTILAGLGGHVLVLRKPLEGQWTPAERCKVFTGQNIHGFAVSKSLTVVTFGGKQLSFLYLSPSPQIILECGVCDWILDVRWLEDTSLAVLTAHGKLLEVTGSSGSVCRQLACPDRSILYSGRIVGTSWEELVILSGTVHNQVLVWTSDRQQNGLILHTLSGHKGVIFSVRCDETTSTICSTSDDRTARLWKVELGDGSSMRECWSKANISLQLTLYGHKARVFQSAFLPSTLLATIGEDGGVMVWEGVSGECVSQSWVQGGLLCLDYHADTATDRFTLAAGSADGSLCLFPLRLPPPPLSHLGLPETQVARQVLLTADRRLVVYCEGGHILVSSGSTWTRVHSSPLISSYCVWTLSPSRTLLAVGSISGHIFVLSVSDGDSWSVLSSTRPVEGKILSLHWLDEKLLLACCPHGRLCLLTHSSDTGLLATGWFELAESKERWTTSAVLVSPQHLVCGDRQGSLHLYATGLSPHDSVGGEEAKRAVDSVRRVHGRGVGCLARTSAGGVVSCGRDGTVRQYLVLKDRLVPTLSHRLLLDWASHLLLCPSFGHLVLGFHSVYLCVWSISESRFLLKMKCWGGHRSWDVCLSDGADDSETLSLAFIKDKTVHTYTSPLSTLAIPMPLSGHHSKAVNACGVVDKWIVSGGEDCTVRVCCPVEGKGLRQVCSVTSHLSSVRALCVLPPGNSSSSDSRLLVTGGGRAQLKLWSLSPMGELSELSSHMLRSEEELTAAPLDRPEVRYMALAALPLDHNLYRLYTAASDGIIRVFEVEGGSGGGRLRLVESEESGAGRCLLQVRCLRHGGSELCFTGSTDGRVRVLRLGRLGEEAEEAGVRQVSCLHSGGVNALWLSSSAPLSHDRLLLVSGGDDGVLALTLLSQHQQPLYTLTLPHLHTCQITGVAGSGDYLASVGLDQRLCLLRYSVEEGDKLSSMHISTHLSSISDIHGLHIHLHQDYVVALIFGIGMERVRLDTRLAELQSSVSHSTTSGSS